MKQIIEYICNRIKKYHPSVKLIDLSNERYILQYLSNEKEKLDKSNNNTWYLILRNKITEPYFSYLEFHDSNYLGTQMIIDTGKHNYNWIGIDYLNDADFKKFDDQCCICLEDHHGFYCTYCCAMVCDNCCLQIDECPVCRKEKRYFYGAFATRQTVRQLRRKI